MNYLAEKPWKILKELVPDLGRYVHPQGSNPKVPAYEFLLTCKRHGALSDLKEALIKKYPEDRNKITHMMREWGV